MQSRLLRLTIGFMPIQLHVDLQVDLSRTAEIAAVFRDTFVPAIRRQPGFLGVELLKFREARSGSEPGDFTHRLLIRFETEEQRRQWVASEDHQQAWPAIKAVLTGAQYQVNLYDVVGSHGNSQ